MTIRVVQWTTGNVGRRAARAILRHPDLELVGSGAGISGTWFGAVCAAAPGIVGYRDLPLITAREFVTS